MYKLIFTSLIVMLFASGGFAQLIGMSPNQGNHGETLTTSITGNGIFIQTASPMGNIFEIRLQRGSYAIYLYDCFGSFPGPTSFIDPNTISSSFTIPLSAPSGTYALFVTTHDINYPCWFVETTYDLQNVFTVNPPDGYITGSVYLDKNRNGTKDTLESPINGTRIQFQGNSQYVQSNYNGDYSLPAENGNHFVYHNYYSNERLFSTINMDTIPATINNGNSPNNDFPLNTALVSITPSTAIIGQTSTHLITSLKPIFHPSGNPYGNVNHLRLYSSPNISLTPSTSITVIDSFSIEVTITVPPGTLEGSDLDLRLYTTAGYSGYHYLRGQFNIASPPSCQPPLSPYSSDVTSTSMRVNWTPVTGVWRYQVYYKIGGTSTWSTISVNSSSTSLVLNNLVCGTNYRYKIRSICNSSSGNIQSSFTPVIVTSTLTCAPPACQPPNTPFTSNITSTSIRFNWTQVPGVWRYQVFYREAGTTTWISKSTNSSNSSLTVNNLVCGTDYEYKMRSICTTASGNIQSSFTSVSNASTLSCASNNTDRIVTIIKDELNVFPNPATNQISMVLLSEHSGQASIQIYNTLGVMVYSNDEFISAGENMIVTDVSHLVPGLYLMRATGIINAESRIIIKRE